MALVVAAVWGETPSGAAVRAAVPSHYYPPRRHPPPPRSFFGVDECAVVQYDTTDTNIACYTPAHWSGDATVNVQIQLLGIDTQAMWAACPGGGCNYNYRGAQTPQVAFMSLGGAAGKANGVQLSGTLVRVGVNTLAS